MFAPKMVPGTRAAATSRAWASCLGIGLALAAGFKNAPAQISTPAATRGTAIVQHGGYPELRVDGRPFFLHSAAFFYDRTPRDLWSSLLDRYREFGINTIDIYIPWNWHEPKEGEFDFDGHTNPRRDLRGLLQLIALKGFRLVARPGPQILNEWRHGGYPGWLLERPEYNMDLVDRLEGRYPPLSNLNARNAEAAAQGWLTNTTHMAQARIWLAAVAKELAPYSSRRSVRVAPTQGSQGAGPTGAPEETNGPLLFVQLEDDMALGRTNMIGAAFWRYMESLRGMLEAGGLDVPFFINPTDMRVSAAGAALADPIPAMGQWYMPPRTEAETGVRKITAEDASTMEFFVEELKTQPAFPPMLIEYQAGWYCPGDDDRPLESPPENTVLSSRLLLANGLKGINYFPLQDTYTPAGYSVPWANHAYRWDAAFDPDGNEQPRAGAIRRNGQLFQQWGEVLAASHKRADFGIVYPLGAYPQETLKREDILRVSQGVMQLERLGNLASLASELLDPEYQPVDQLLRNAVILLPVFDPGQPQFQLSKKSQDALVEYVRRGGTLVYFPTRPAGDSFQALWQARSSASTSPSAAASAGPARWTFGAGQAIEATKDFYSWIALEQDFSQNLNRTEAEDSLRILRSFMNAAGVRPTIERAGGLPSREIVATQLVSNEGTGVLGARASGQGFLSVTNLSEKPVEEVLRVLSPRASARRASAADNSYITLHVSVPGRESLLLPLEEPLCSGAPSSEPCRDSLLSAEAELTRAERKGKTLELSFYAPARAEIDLSFENKPSHAGLDNSSAEAEWDESQRRFHVVVPRGAAPGFLRVLKIDLPYTPHVREKPKAPRNTPLRVYDYSLTSAMHLPAGGNSALASFPPLMAIEASRPVDLLFEFHNLTDETRRVNVKVEGPLHGSGELGLPSGGWGILKLELKAASGRKFTDEGLRPEGDGFIHSTLEIHADQDRRSMPMNFVLVREGKTNRYEFDFDRDGANERVLENAQLRLIVSPESGGRALALLDKSSGSNLISSVGALRDNFAFAENPPGARPERARGRYGLFNRAYKADWMDEQGNPALHMSYDAPDVLPFGARVEKTVRLASSEEIQVDYRIRLDGRAGERAGGANGSPPQSFVAVNSVPALSESDNSTRLCWLEPVVLVAGSEPASQTGGRDGSRTSPTKHCEDFVAGGAPLVLPESTRELKIFTPGRPGLALEWQEGRMTIERKNFSALLRLEFPPLTPGGAPGNYSVSFRILASEGQPTE